MLIRLVAGALSEALGASNIITLTDQTTNGTYGRTAGVIVSNNGDFYRYILNAPVVVSNWITPATNLSQYEIRATHMSGDALTTGTLDTWQSLSTSRYWTMSSSTEEEELAATVLLEIRWTGNNVVQDSATITFNVSGPPTGGGGPGGGNNDPGQNVD